eukprot:CAMPEP_0206447002 /NCGR_PEP_ID=MMETSP0324_2-20121206/16502_1 /ASSEMBLY_ACC=CAM_ASM_000836 /TAXON_ID=2866 /ORGANISM="Crypthecodinium cohnii, Strain Seligo" /LENGTH=407 /DNA_ID=CAMNT_0053915641 /DNA_START=38 /DNA_END=1261 /DNA_ORIENTATION=+
MSLPNNTAVAPQDDRLHVIYDTSKAAKTTVSIVSLPTATPGCEDNNSNNEANIPAKGVPAAGGEVVVGRPPEGLPANDEKVVAGHIPEADKAAAEANEAVPLMARNRCCCKPWMFVVLSVFGTLLAGISVAGVMMRMTHQPEEGHHHRHQRDSDQPLHPFVAETDGGVLPAKSIGFTLGVSTADVATFTTDSTVLSTLKTSLLSGFSWTADASDIEVSFSTTRRLNLRGSSRLLAGIAYASVTIDLSDLSDWETTAAQALAAISEESYAATLESKWNSALSSASSSHAVNILSVVVRPRCNTERRDGHGDEHREGDHEGNHDEHGEEHDDEHGEEHDEEHGDEHGEDHDHEHEHDGEHEEHSEDHDREHDHEHDHEHDGEHHAEHDGEHDEDHDHDHEHGDEHHDDD